MSAENTTRPAQPQQGYSGRERLVTRRCLLVVFLAALCVRGLAGWYAGAAQPQEVRYITIARGILTGRGFTGLDTRFPDIIQPPLFPLILSVVQRLPAPDLAMARGASILLGALLVFPAAALARRIFGEQTARRSAALVAVHPLLVHVSSAAITESTFTLLVILGALGIWSGAESPGRRALAPVLGAGLLFGGAFLTRPEGLAYLAMSLLVLIAVRARQPEARRALPILSACLLGAFVLLVTPYTVWVHARLGQWLLAPKAVLVQVHQALVQEGQREMWKEPYGSVLFFERVKFGLNADATAIRSHEQFATAGASLRDGLLVSEEGDVTVSDPGVAARMVARNLKEFYLETVKYGYVLPSVIMILAGIGLLSRPWTGRFPQAALITIAFFLASFSFLLSHVESRFLFTSLPFALPWAAEGWRRTEVWAIASISGGGVARAGLRQHAVRLILGGLVSGLTLVHLVPSLRTTASLWSEHREIGLWLRRTHGPGGVLMAATSVPAYYADARYEVLPYDELARVVTYARHRRVDFIVADRAEIPSFRPGLTSLLIPARAHPGLELVKSLREGTRHAIYIYRVLPEAVESARR